MRRRRKITLLVVCGVLCLILFAIFQQDFWRLFPQFCPLARHLPDDARAIQCIHEGMVDFSIQFSAEASPQAVEVFVANLAESLGNATIVRGTEAGTSDIKITKPGGVIVDIFYGGQIMNVDYYSY